MSAELLSGLGFAAAVVGAAAAWMLRTGGYRTRADTPRRSLVRWWWLMPALVLTLLGIGASAADTRLMAGDLVYATGGLIVAGIDLDVHRIPNRILVIWAPALGAALVAQTVVGGDAQQLVTIALAAGALGGFYLMLALGWSMGLGDVKLAAVTGAAVGAHGWNAVLTATMATFLTGGAVAAVLMLRGRDRRAHIPFGPAIVAGALLALVVYPGPLAAGSGLP
ncbi:MAG: prepilin peptidase [Dermatophilaceae bacterium]